MGLFLKWRTSARWFRIVWVKQFESICLTHSSLKCGNESVSVKDYGVFLTSRWKCGSFKFRKKALLGTCRVQYPPESRHCLEDTSAVEFLETTEAAHRYCTFGWRCLIWLRILEHLDKCCSNSLNFKQRARRMQTVWTVRTNGVGTSSVCYGQTRHCFSRFANNLSFTCSPKNAS